MVRNDTAMADYAIVNLLEVEDDTRGRFPGMEVPLRPQEPRLPGPRDQPDGLELIAVGGPKPEGGDGVRSDAPWPDEG